MPSPSFALAFALSFTFLVRANPLELVARQNCADNYNKCSPSGATATDTPPVGNALSSLYVDIVNSISGIKIKRDLEEIPEVLQDRASSNPVCCVEGTLCLLLHDLNVPFCYDKFTTNFFLPDGSYGTITTGNYSSADGSAANLLSGNYTLANGTLGNVYTGNEAAKPNTATLSMPTPYTSAGVGSAIPASILGGEATYTTTIPGTTVEPTTIPAQTVPASVASGSTVVPATTKPATTEQGTTIAPKVLTITKAVSTTGTASVTASGKQSAANLVTPRNTHLAGATGFALILFTFFGS
ncbi:MAG: hypothetical protein M1830_006763 [Pleopsidium flavum]|nr:MAG: hypothetical protein M1830_006763 [Pleopsidium flavum]